MGNNFPTIVEKIKNGNIAVDSIRNDISFRSHPLSEPYPFSVRSAGYNQLVQKHIPTVKRIFSFVAIRWCIDGKAVMLVDDKRIKLHSNELVFIYPGQGVKWETIREKMTFASITFDGPVAESMAREFGFKDKIKIDFDENMEKLIQNLRYDLENTESRSQAGSTQKLFRLLCYIRSKCSYRSLPQVGSLFTEAQKLIEKNYRNPIFGVNELSEILKVSQKALLAEFRRYSGETPKNFIDSVRLRKVFLMLKDKNISVNEIARANGFSSANYMSKFFRRKMNITPTEFRERNY